MSDQLRRRFQVALRETARLRRQQAASYQQLCHAERKAAELDEQRTNDARIFQAVKQEQDAQVRILQDKLRQSEEERVSMAARNQALLQRNDDVEREVRHLGATVTTQRHHASADSPAMTSMRQEMEALKQQLHQIHLVTTERHPTEAASAPGRRRHASGPSREQLKASMEKLERVVEKLRTENLQLSANEDSLREENGRLQDQLYHLRDVALQAKDEHSALLAALEEERKQKEMALVLSGLWQQQKAMAEASLTRLRQWQRVLGIEFPLNTGSDRSPEREKGEWSRRKRTSLKGKC